MVETISSHGRIFGRYLRRGVFYESHRERIEFYNQVNDCFLEICFKLCSVFLFALQHVHHEKQGREKKKQPQSSLGHVILFWFCPDHSYLRDWYRLNCIWPGPVLVLPRRRKWYGKNCLWPSVYWFSFKICSLRTELRNNFKNITRLTLFCHRQSRIQTHLSGSIYIYRESASRFSHGAVLNTLKQSGRNILRGKKDATTLTILFHGASYHLALPTTAPVKL